MHQDITHKQIEELRHAARMVVRELGLLGDAYFDIGVTLAERHLLIELASAVYPDVGEMAKRLLLDKSTVSRLVAKAVKKGFVKYTIDENDKRRRCLHLTEKGKKTLHAFEPLAQVQVKDALLTLNEQEKDIVQQGIALFAKGLSKARLRKEFRVEPIGPQDNVTLAHLVISVLEEYGCNKPGFAAQDEELQAMYEAYQQKGCVYYVLKKDSKVVGGAGIAPLQGGESGVCELRKMYLGSDVRGLGLGDLLLEACLKQAKHLEYHTCYLETTAGMVQAQKLYLHHGFVRLPKRKGNTSHFGCDAFFEKKL